MCLPVEVAIPFDAVSRRTVALSTSAAVRLRRRQRQRPLIRRAAEDLDAEELGLEVSATLRLAPDEAEGTAGEFFVLDAHYYNFRSLRGGGGSG